MKRILLAVLAVTMLLLYPSSNLIAGSPASNDRPNVMTPKDYTPGWPIWDSSGPAGNDGDDDDKGDADDLAGLKDNTRLFGVSNFGPDTNFDALVAIKAYWMYFYIHMLR